METTLDFLWRSTVIKESTNLIWVMVRSPARSSPPKKPANRKSQLGEHDMNHIKHHKTTSQPTSVGIYISITYWKPSPEAKVHKLLPGLEGLQILALLGRSAAAACRQLGERRLGLAAVHAADTLNVAWQSAPEWLLKPQPQQKMLWIRMILNYVYLEMQYSICHMIVIFIFYLPTYIPYF